MCLNTTYKCIQMQSHDPDGSVSWYLSVVAALSYIYHVENLYVSSINKAILTQRVGKWIILANILGGNIVMLIYFRNGD